MAREVRIAIIGDPSSLQRALRTADTGVTRFGARMQTFGTRMRSFGASMSRNLTLPLVGFGVLAYRELSAGERALAPTQAVIESTGGAARQSVDDILELSHSLSQLTSIDDEPIQEAANTLLTFREIAGDTFEEATRATLDLSVAMDRDLRSSAVMVGRALNDPIRGMAALTRVGVHGFQIPAGTSEWTVWTWQCFLWQAGGEILDAENRSAAFDSRAGVSALEFWRALLADGSAVFSETDAGYKTSDFLAGRVAMVINGPWNYAEIQTQQNIDVGVFPLPANERAATNIGGESLFLFQSDPARERAAWEFMKFVMSPDFQIDWAIATGYLPVAKSAATSPEYLAFLDRNAFLEVYNRQMNVGKVRPSVPEYAAVSAILGRQIEAALYGKYSSEEALARAAAETDRLLR